MERLFAPWRGSYVTGGMRAGGCFLCEKPAVNDDRENLVLARGAAVYVVMNLYPYNSGHVLVAPYVHTGDLQRLPAAVCGEIMAMTQRCLAALGSVYRPEGFNVGFNLGAVAGASEAEHLHQHIVPRWGGDTNFMTAIGQTKVLPETLQQTYDRLLPKFREHD